MKRFTTSLLFLLAPLAAAPSNETVFSDIYKNKVWGTNSRGEGFSGGGSTVEASQPYREFLTHFLHSYGIRSVVDVGCGDWEFSRLINWEGIDYVGFDVVPSVIQKNQARYTSPNIHFFHGDATLTKLPSADLLLCKDVLQHLPNEDILQFLRQVGKFKYCLITNDVDPTTLTSHNPQIDRGNVRFVDLTKPPFNLVGTKIFTYRSLDGVTKQVLLLKLPGL